MNLIETNHYLVALFSLFGLIIIWMWLYHDYRIDLFRQRMFSLRDELFDEGCKGVISFNHPAYGMLRSTMNGFIRFGHRIGLVNFIVFVISLNKEEREAWNEISWEARWKEATEDLPSETEKKLFEYRIKMNILLVEHLAFASIFVILAVITPASIVVMLQKLSKYIVNKFGAPIGYIDSAALALGSES